MGQNLSFFFLSNANNRKQLVRHFSTGTLKGFVQINEDIIVCTDNHMNCIWKVNQTSDTASVLAGVCSDRGGFANGRGVEAKFNKPSGIVTDRRNVSYVIVADYMNRLLRHVSVDTGHVTTLKQLNKYPIALVWIEENLLVSAHNFLILLEWEASTMTYKESILNQNKKYKRYGSFSDVRFTSLSSLEVISNGLILAAEDQIGVFILIDLRRELSLPVCINETNCLESTVLTPKQPKAYCTLATSDGLFALLLGNMFNLTGDIKHMIFFDKYINSNQGVRMCAVYVCVLNMC